MKTESRDTLCYFSETCCVPVTWSCETCHKTFCLTHSHVTTKGKNRECKFCERERKDAEILNESDKIERIAVKTNVLDKLDITDK